jgi:hypothetical protein
MGFFVTFERGRLPGLLQTMFYCAIGLTIRMSVDESHELGCYVCAVPGSIE